MDTDDETEFDIRVGTFTRKRTSITNDTEMDTHTEASRSTIPVNNTHTNANANANNINAKHHAVADNSAHDHHDNDNDNNGNDNDDQEWIRLPQDPHPHSHTNPDSRSRTRTESKSPPPIISPTSDDLEIAKELTLSVTNTEDEEERQDDGDEQHDGNEEHELGQDGNAAMESPSRTIASMSTPNVNNNTDNTSNTDNAQNEKIDSIKAYYENKLLVQRKEQEEQIDEVLEHLNSIELTYADKLSKKDIMTEALTNSLTSYQVKNEEIKQQNEISLTRLDEAKQEIEAGHERYQALKKQMEHEKMQAIREAQDQIRLAAERQFASAQKTYMKLQQDYRESCQEKDILSQKCQEMVQSVETLEAKERENDGEMSKQMSEVAYAKAAMATVQAEMLKMKQGYNGKIQSYIDREKVASGELQRAEKDCSEARVLVEDALKEKEAARKENLELQTLCEELMGIVEGNAKWSEAYV